MDQIELVLLQTDDPEAGARERVPVPGAERCRHRVVLGQNAVEGRGASQPVGQPGQVLLPRNRELGGDHGRDVEQLGRRPHFAVEVDTHDQVRCESQHFLEIHGRREYPSVDRRQPGRRGVVAGRDHRKLQRQSRFQIEPGVDHDHPLWRDRDVVGSERRGHGPGRGGGSVRSGRRSASHGERRRPEGNGPQEASTRQGCGELRPLPVHADGIEVRPRRVRGRHQWGHNVSKRVRGTIPRDRQAR